MINDLISKLPGFTHNIIYELITYQDLKLCLDVGAAAGIITKRIIESGSSKTQVMAFEPFPGNHSYFLENTRGYQGVLLVKKAVSNQSGSATFHVPSIVKDQQTVYGNMPGYSSVGFLEGGFNCERQALNNTTDASELSVETVVLDEIIDSHVDFMKMDIQGGEFNALKGCETLIKAHGIDVIYVEFDGDMRVLEFLSSCGYTIFDTDYLLLPVHNDCKRVEAEGFYDFEEVDLSTGHKAYYAKLRRADDDYCSFFNTFKQQHGSIYTDLICVSSSFLPHFLVNLSEFVKDQSSPKLLRDVRSSLRMPRTGGLIVRGRKITSIQNRITSSASIKNITELVQELLSSHGSSTFLIAGLAVFLNVFALLLPDPLNELAIAGGTLLLLILVGYAVNKASKALTDVEELRADSEQKMEHLRKILKKKSNKLTPEKRLLRRQKRQQKRHRKFAHKYSEQSQDS